MYFAGSVIGHKQASTLCGGISEMGPEGDCRLTGIFAAKAADHLKEGLPAAYARRAAHLIETAISRSN
jgi:hypothetical protein